MFKFLDASGATYFEGKETVYSLPRPDEKWGPWMEHPTPSEPDGQACGPGGYHLMLGPNAVYAPNNWWPWWAEGRGVIGSDRKKARFQAVRLRRIAPKVWHRVLRLGWCRGADLSRADLQGANLREANIEAVLGIGRPDV